MSGNPILKIRNLRESKLSGCVLVVVPDSLAFVGKWEKLGVREIVAGAFAHAAQLCPLFSGQHVVIDGWSDAKALDMTRLAVKAAEAGAITVWVQYQGKFCRMSQKFNSVDKTINTAATLIDWANENPSEVRRIALGEKK